MPNASKKAEVRISVIIVFNELDVKRMRKVMRLPCQLFREFVKCWLGVGCGLKNNGKKKGD